MRNLLHLKFLSLVLIVALLTVTINGVCESAHAMQSHVPAASDQAFQSEISLSDKCPCCPLEHNDFDGCDTCINCVCHVSLNIQQFELSYNPIIVDLKMSDPFRHIPEVYLSKFIPPQNLA